MYSEEYSGHLFFNLSYTRRYPVTLQLHLKWLLLACILLNNRNILNHNEHTRFLHFSKRERTWSKYCCKNCSVEMFQNIGWFKRIELSRIWYKDQCFQILAINCLLNSLLLHIDDYSTNKLLGYWEFERLCNTSLSKCIYKRSRLEIETNLRSAIVAHISIPQSFPLLSQFNEQSSTKHITSYDYF